MEVPAVAIARFLGQQKQGERHHFGTLHEFTLLKLGHHLVDPAADPADVRRQLPRSVFDMAGEVPKEIEDAGQSD
jgi:hypothetical protein